MRLFAIPVRGSIGLNEGTDGMGGVDFGLFFASLPVQTMKQRLCDQTGISKAKQFHIDIVGLRGLVRS